MSRDSEKLTVFRMSHELAVEVCRLTATYPLGERFGLQAQLRRAAVSSVTNIVEGATRSTTADYLRFLEVAMGSASEAGCLVELAVELGLAARPDAARCRDGYDRLVRSLQKMITTLQARGGVARNR